MKWLIREPVLSSMHNVIKISLFPPTNILRLRDVTTLFTYLKVLDTTNNGTKLQLGQLNKKIKYLNK